MHCPYCKSATEAGTPSCQRCGMSLEKVSRLFGVVPRIVEGISDDAGVLSDGAKRRIRSDANELSIRFPQINFSAVIAKLPADTSISVFAFWIFNQAGIARKLDRGSNNHGILLTIDPGNGRASLMVGYGLEPFLSEEALGSIVTAAHAAFEAGKFAAGIVRIIDQLEKSLTSIVATLPETHGVAPIVSAKSTSQVVSPTEF